MCGIVPTRRFVPLIADLHASMHAPFCQRLLCTLVVSLVLIALPPLSASASSIDPWTSIQGDTSWSIGEERGRTPEGAPTAWRERRNTLGMSVQTLAFTGRRFEDAHLLIDTLADEELLAWEKALIVANHDAGHLSQELTQGWVDLLRTWPSLGSGERVQQHLSLRLRIVDAGLASLAPKCLPSSLSNAQLLTELADIEASIPGRRLRSRVEPPPQRPAQLTDAALQSSDSSPIRAAVSLLALTSPATPLLTQWADASSPSGVHCAERNVQRFFRLMLDPRIDGVETFDALARNGSTFPISQRWLWRVAVHRYLMGDEHAVRHVSAYFIEHYASNVEGAEIMQLLSDIADGTPSSTRTLWPRAGAGTNPTYQWVTAEAARVRRLNTEAEAALSRITDSDVHFVAAWISLAAARDALGRGRGVHLALQTLESIAPPLPIYDYWRATLRARTQSLGIPSR